MINNVREAVGYVFLRVVPSNHAERNESANGYCWQMAYTVVHVVSGWQLPNRQAAFTFTVFILHACMSGAKTQQTQFLLAIPLSV